MTGEAKGGDEDANLTTVGSLTFSARLRYLSSSGDPSSSSAKMLLGAASGLAGSSARVAGATIRTVGHAGRFLGTSSAAAVRSVSPSRLISRKGRAN